jgi:hypothetical protein
MLLSHKNKDRNAAGHDSAEMSESVAVMGLEAELQSPPLALGETNSVLLAAGFDAHP